MTGERAFLFRAAYSLIWIHGKHSVRWGGDFRRVQLNTETSSNARGSFIFSGTNAGYDFADFLYGGCLMDKLPVGCRSRLRCNSAKTIISSGARPKSSKAPPWS
jgi:hypothetical protein